MNAAVVATAATATCTREVDVAEASLAPGAGVPVDALVVVVAAGGTIAAAEPTVTPVTWSPRLAAKALFNAGDAAAVATAAATIAGDCALLAGMIWKDTL